MSGSVGTPVSPWPVERAWDSLWPQFALRSGFWLAYVFSSNMNVIRPLTERAEDYARMRVRHTEARWAAEPEELTDALKWLLGEHPPDLMLAWVVGAAGESRRWRSAWPAFLRRLNERRDLLRQTMPAGLVLVGPGGMLDVFRDSAPDLWSYRSAVIDLGAVDLGATDLGDSETPAPPAALIQAPVVTRRDPHAIAERALLPTAEPAPAVRTALQQAAQALRAGEVAAAVAAGRAALTAAESTGSDGDRALSHARLARALEAAGDAVGAIDHARRALDLDQPLGPSLTRALLTILGRSPNRDMVLAAARVELALARLLVRDAGDTPESLRDLSISLNNVARINRLQGNLDTAHTHYTEALHWYELLDRRYGPPLSDPTELAACREAVDRAATLASSSGDE